MVDCIYIFRDRLNRPKVYRHLSILTTEHDLCYGTVNKQIREHTDKLSDTEEYAYFSNSIYTIEKCKLIKK